MVAARMPQREHLESVAFHLVVDEISDPPKEEASYARSSRPFILGPHPRLLGQQGDGLAEVSANRSWSGRAILLPPLGCFLDLFCGLGRKS